MKTCLTMFLLALAAFAGALQFDLNLPASTTDEAYQPLLQPGNPQVKFYPLRVLLPYGHNLQKVMVTYAAPNQTSGYVDFTKQPQPTQSSMPDRTVANQQVYGKDAMFPAADFANLGVQRLNGRDYAIINLYNHRYNPVTSEQAIYTKASLTLVTEFNQKTADTQGRMLVKSSPLLAGTLNPNQASSYVKTSTGATRSLVNPNYPYDMIIVTASRATNWFDSYIQYLAGRNITAGVFTTDQIYMEYEGRDEPEQIRNFVIDAYATYSNTQHPLTYLILGGDDELVPERGMYVNCYGTVDEHLPSDFYYGALDGNFNADGDNRWGETNDDVDWLSEVMVGRMPAETQTEFNNIFNKIEHYVTTSNYTNDIAVMIGENLNWNPVTWGGDYKDEVVPYIPEDYNISTIYERDGDYSSQNVKNAINSGLAIINHMGHSNESIVFGINSSTAGSFINTEFGFAYSQGCYPAAFDSTVLPQSECVAERLVTAPAGLYSFIGNTRYGWYSPGDTNGPSQYYDIAFFDGMFNYNKRALGEALEYSRQENVNYIDDATMRWVYYEMVIFGDPSTRVKDPVGGFPMLAPANPRYQDVNGDNDGYINPGEQVDLYVDIAASADWDDAINAWAKITISDSSVEVLTDSVFYGNVTAGTTLAGSQPFTFVVGGQCHYDDYQYQITIGAQTATGSGYSSSYPLTFALTLNQPGWPWAGSYALNSAPWFDDWDNDGEKELVLTNASGTTMFQNGLGEVEGSINCGRTLNIRKSCAYADLDGDGNNEIIIADLTGHLIAQKYSGEVLFDQELQGYGVAISPVVADFDGDGDDEIAVCDLSHTFLVYDASGQAVGQPIEVPDIMIHEFAAEDIDSDGAAELICGDISGLLHAYNIDGTEVNGFPVDIDEPVVVAPIVSANGFIVTGTDTSRLVVVDSDGNVRVDRTLPGVIAESAIAADFTGDGIPELAALTTNGWVCVLNAFDGTDLDGFPIQTDTRFMQPPLAADVDNNGSNDLLAMDAFCDFYAWNANGSLHGYAPVPVDISSPTPFTLADVDNDGDIEVVVGNTFGVSALDIKLPYGTVADWPVYRSDAARTGSFSYQLVLDAGSNVIPQLKTSLAANSPNPFNPTTSISYQIEKSGQVNLSVYDLRGRLVRTLVKGTVPAGRHTVVFNGTDNNNRPLGSGLYLYRLHSKNANVTRKMLLLK